MRLVYEPILPKEYTRLEYLEAFSSTAVAYISIPYTPNTNTNFETKVRYNSNSTSNTWAMGATTWWGVHLNSGTQIGITNSSATASKAYANYTAGTDAVLKLDGNSVYVNDVLVGTITKANATSTLDIFRYYNGNNLWWNGRIYYLKIDDGTTKINLIPALRNSDSEPGMYDTVSGTFYTNAGAGAFNYKVIENSDTVDNPKYQQVEYLESTGTQYILSGFTPTLNTDYEITLSSTNTGLNRWVMGCPTWVGVHYKGATNEVGVTCSSTAIYQQYVSYAHDDSKLTMRLTGNTVYANDVLLGTLTKRAGTLDFALFGYRDPNQGATLNYVGKIYKCLIKDNGIPVRNLIPVIRKADNKPGMYDKVTGQFFTNSSTIGDDFNYGEKVYNILPSKYEKLEYLKSDGNQYIDTGISAKTGLSVEAKIKYTTINGILCGAITTSTGSGDRYYALNFSQSNKVAFTYLDSAFSASTTLTPNEMYTIKTVISNTRQEMFINGVSGGYTTKTNDVDLNFTLGLFALHRGGSFDREWFSEAALPVYYCKIWDGDTLVRYFQPALRKADNKPGMYDFVSGQFFTNLGTGEFTYDYSTKPLSNSKLRIVKTGGYDIIDDLYKRVDYLESTGTQYIDTGIDSADVDTIFELTFAKRTIPSSGNYLYGADSILTGTQNGNIAFTTIPAVAETFYKTRLEYTVGQKRKIYVNDEYIGEASNYHAVYRIRLFSLDAKPLVTYDSFLIKETKITMEGKLVRHLIPVIRISDSKPGMYDKVTRTFFTNAGTGEFIYPTPTLTKPLVTRFVAGGYVASIYKPLQYLESTGTQYIDTGITGSNKIRMEVICQGSQGDKAVAGCGETGDRLQIYAGATYYSVRIDGTATTSNTPSLNKAQIILDAVSQKATVNGTIYSLPYTGSIASRNIHLFRVNRIVVPSSDTTYNFIGKIWQFKLYDNGTLVRNFIPVIRKTDNKPGMYDKVTGQFFTNEGTGEFSYA